VGTEIRLADKIRVETGIRLEDKTRVETEIRLSKRQRGTVCSAYEQKESF
jgi:acyl-CoA thioesterase FadM